MDLVGYGFVVVRVDLSLFVDLLIKGSLFYYYDFDTFLQYKKLIESMDSFEYIII